MATSFFGAPIISGAAPDRQSSQVSEELKAALKFTNHHNDNLQPNKYQ